MELEEIKIGQQVTGIIPGHIARIVSVESAGESAITVIVKSELGVTEQQLYRSDESRLALAERSLPWSFESKAEDFKLALEALRIELGSAFDPMMAIHSSNVIPLPHQISAVYEKMLPQQPLRYVLADDPGVGKTIMAGLLIKELLMRADVRRVLIVSPGSLTEQWQAELSEKFAIDFRIFSKETEEQSVSGNFFADEDLVVARVDMLSRNEDYQRKLEEVEWDLVIVDEAHKMSAHWFGKKLQTSLRYELGKLLSRQTRHILLMTATPHNGKDEDFRLWLQLIDDDRYYSIAHAKGGKVAIGPGMGVYSKYAAVLKSDGSKLSVHEAMIEINKEVDRYLHPDGQSYDPSTNFFVTWFETHGYGEGPFGEADVLARAKGTTVQFVVDSEVAESSAGKMRILHFSEYPDDPKEDTNLPLWEACHRVIRELVNRNREAAAKLLAMMPGKASDIRQLAYYLYTYCEKHGDAANARAYNALIISWSEIMTIMSELGGEESGKLEQGGLGYQRRNE